MQFFRNLLRPVFGVFRGPCIQNLSISYILNTFIYSYNIFSIHLSHFKLGLHPTFRRVPRPKWEKIVFSSILFKVKRDQKSIFCLGLFPVQFCPKRVQIKVFLTYLIEKWVKLAIFEKKMQFKGLKKAISPSKILSQPQPFQP